ncbi:MAG: TetR/AcrR family transcriptional regulator [Spirochaetes bacterium]|nr:TetR/AcrR family transcriptional regulator [Spirochaetota bacterium]
MPPKAIYKREDLIGSSLKIIKEKGTQQLSAREVARELNSSTRPVYEHFQSMGELRRAALQRTVDLLYDYVTRRHTQNAFLNIGVGYAMFARDHREFFRAIFLEDNDASGVIDEMLRKLDREMVKVPELKGLTYRERQTLLRRCWIYTHGFAAMVFSGYIEDVRDRHIITMLAEAGMIFIEDSLGRHGKEKRGR